MRSDAYPSPATSGASSSVVRRSSTTRRSGVSGRAGSSVRARVSRRADSLWAYTCWATSAATSTRPRAPGDSWANRDSITACTRGVSRLEPAGQPACTASTTKSGFPSVCRCSAFASASVSGPAPSCLASRAVSGRCSRSSATSVSAPAECSALTSSASGRCASMSSPRAVPTTSSGVRVPVRTRWCSSCSASRSHHWRSSATSSRGAPEGVSACTTESYSRRRCSLSGIGEGRGSPGTVVSSSGSSRASSVRCDWPSRGSRARTSSERSQVTTGP